MSDRIEKAGGAAFPVPMVPHHYLGLTTRDYFAAAALTGLLANPEINYQNREEGVQDAYKYADIALLERARLAQPQEQGA